ncbi:MAG: hypothetical protein CMF52_07235 [Legionellales bacterium]|nr:hypothetical protein [Legionellales bacterium]
MNNHANLTACVTGCTDGIGRALCLRLAAEGVNMLLCARSAEKAENLIKDLNHINPRISCKFISCDLESIDSCATAIHEIKRGNPLIDLLMLNAGIADDASARTADGYNKVFFVNHISHQALAMGLADHLSFKARVIVQSSLAHRAASHPDTFDSYLRPYQAGNSTAYADSKLANLLFIKALPIYLAQYDRSSVLCAGAHPGYMVTNINRSTVQMGMMNCMRWGLRGNIKPLLLSMASSLGICQPSNDAAALSMLHAACHDEPSFYTGPGGFAELYGKPDRAKLSTYVNNHNARVMWRRTEACINLMQMVPRES